MDIVLTLLVLPCTGLLAGLQAEGGLIEGKIEYRVWNPFRSKLAAAILGGVEKIHIQPGSKVLYLGAASGTTVSHVADIVGPVSGHMICRHVVTYCTGRTGVCSGVLPSLGEGPY